jgi:hypothetical protein
LHSGNQIAGMVTYQGQLGKTAELLHAALASQEVSADVVTLQTGGVHRRFRPLLDQAALSSKAENSVKQSVKSPFFSSRCSA